MLAASPVRIDNEKASQASHLPCLLNHRREILECETLRNGLEHDIR